MFLCFKSQISCGQPTLQVILNMCTWPASSVCHSQSEQSWKLEETNWTGWARQQDIKAARSSKYRAFLSLNVCVSVMVRHWRALFHRLQAFVSVGRVSVGRAQNGALHQRQCGWACRLSAALLLSSRQPPAPVCMSQAFVYWSVQSGLWRTPLFPRAGEGRFGPALAQNRKHMHPIS